jgi:GDPmannose 4,6-dehydratase
MTYGLQETIYMGNLNALRDWGHAADYAEAQWLMLQQDMPRDYVIATGEQHSVRAFCEAAFREVGVSLIWRGEGLQEVGSVAAVEAGSDFPLKLGTVVIRIAEDYFRPTEVDTLLGDAAKARRELGWKPRIPMGQLVREMVTSDLKAARLERMKVDAKI